MDESDREIARLTGTANESKAQVEALEARIEHYEARIDVLTEKATAKRKEMDTAFREKVKARFADIDVKKALVFGDSRHAVKIGNIIQYIVSLPSGAINHQVDVFTNDESETGKTFGPFSYAEVALMKYLIGGQVLNADGTPGAEKSFVGMPLEGKIGLIRTLPITTADRVASECLDMQAYINAVLDSEMGN